MLRYFVGLALVFVIFFDYPLRRYYPKLNTLISIIIIIVSIVMVVFGIE